MPKQIESEAQLTFWEATAIIVGHGVGSGILSVPFLAGRNRFSDVVWIILLAYLVNLILHFMIAELSYNNGGAQFLKCFENELFVGRYKKVITWVVFVLMGISGLMNMAGFIAGAGAVFHSWFGLPLPAGKIIYFLLAAVVVFSGMKLVGICEKYSILGMILVIVLLFIATLSSEAQAISGDYVAFSNLLALYGMVSFSLSAVMSTPQVVKGLQGNVKKIRASIATGLAINVALIFLITIMTLLAAGKNVSENGALVDLADHIGGSVGIIGYVFTLLALSTSFWANTLNMRDVVHEQTGWGLKTSYLVSSIPCLLLALVGATSFVGFTRLASVIQVLTGLGIILAYNRSKKREGNSPICGRFSGLFFQLLIILFSLLASVGAILPVK